MVLSDRHYGAQIRVPPGEGRKWGKVYKFDDIGCAVLWMDQQPWKEGPAIEIWVADHRDGQWLDARSAYYVTGKTTPMEYGLGASGIPRRARSASSRRSPTSTRSRNGSRPKAR